ncbi:unnamed protein product [Clonostachys rosea]|uniref:Uncharacterized protein n=1 Tax=Bionectria ochroleuca TaxID=29856 RepID=A0ABY6UPS1_BIOOC|nr:unnamed protein product [Clonostachys rosea]
MSNAFENALRIAEADDVQIVVRRIDDKLGNLFILSNKSFGRNSPKTPKERKLRWTGNFAEFCTEWLSENINTIPDHFNESSKEQPSPCTRTEI